MKNHKKSDQNSGQGSLIDKMRAQAESESMQVVEAEATREAQEKAEAQAEAEAARAREVDAELAAEQEKAKRVRELLEREAKIHKENIKNLVAPHSKRPARKKPAPEQINPYVSTHHSINFRCSPYDKDSCQQVVDDVTDKVHKEDEWRKMSVGMVLRAFIHIAEEDEALRSRLAEYILKQMPR